MTFRLGELFCGPGGLALGAKQAFISKSNEVYKIDHAWANDIDENSCSTFMHNICPNQPDSVICKDVRNLKVSELSPIDCFAYGFPCNDFSIVGEQKGFHGTFGPLYLYGVSIINYFKPKFFFAENVGGLVTANGGKAFSKILSDLESSGDGYNLTTNLYKAEQYGVPQTRHRIIIIGISKKEGFFFKVPKPTHLNSFVSSRDAIETPPIPCNALNNEKAKQSRLVEERLKHIRPGENAWTADLPNNLKLNVLKARLSQIYKRLDPEKPSYTITGSGGGGTHCYHWNEPRALTNRERARLQTFPDSYFFYGNRESVRKQIGMAVPPLLSRVILSHVLKCFAGIEYEHVSANVNHQPHLFSNKEALQ